MAAKARGAALPVVRTRCISLIAADGLTAKRRAAARIELPPSTPRTMGRPKSQQMGPACQHLRLVSTDILSNHGVTSMQ
jgi:hypothetical protein